jgi:peptidoglycan hydrolase-like protein with peptidoglycan-binding domain
MHQYPATITWNSFIFDKSSDRLFQLYGNGNNGASFQGISGGLVENGQLYNNRGAGMWIYASNNIQVLHNLIYGSAGKGIALGDQSNAALAVTNSTVAYNTIHDTGETVTSTAQGAPAGGTCDAITAAGDAITAHLVCTGLSIYDNLIYNNCDDGSALVLTSTGTFYNNTVYHNGWGGADLRGGFYTGGTGSWIIKNNILENNYPYDLNITPTVLANSTLDYNQYYNTGTTTPFNITGNTTGITGISWTTYHTTDGYEIHSNYGDPLFISTTTPDFHLQSTSPNIDTGTPVSLTSDYTGTNLIYGAPDIGAYEFQPPYTFASNNIPVTGTARLYANGQYDMTSASSTSAVAHFSVQPVGGFYTASTSEYMDLAVNTWTSSEKNWTASSTSSSFATDATSTVYTIGDLLANTAYTFSLDGTASTTAIANNSECTNGICTADGSGNLAFTYQGNYSNHIFDLTGNVTPVLTEITPVATPSKNTTPSYVFSSSAVGTLLYAGACSPSSSTSISIGTNTVTFNALADGTYTNCKLSVIDAAGNDSATTTLASFLIDTTAPTGTINNVSGNPTNQVTPTLNLTIADAGVGVASAQMRLSCDSNSWSAWGPFASATTTFNVDTGPGCTNADGAKVVYVKYEDSLGNASSASAIHTNSFLLVTSIPNDASLSNTPATYGSYASSTAASITVGGTGVANYEYKLDSGSYSASTPVATPITLSSLSEGTHVLYVIGEDAAGNWQSTSNPTTDTWTVDTTGPTGSIQNGSGSPIDSATPTLNLTIADAGVGVASAQMRLSCDSNSWSAWGPFASATTTFNVDTGAGCTNADGTKIVYVEYEDALSNIGSAYNTGTFTLDTGSGTTVTTTPAPSSGGGGGGGGGSIITSTTATTAPTISTTSPSGLTEQQIQSILSLLESFGGIDQATISNVQAALSGTLSTTTTSSSCSFTSALTIGSSGAEVSCLQNALIADGYSIPAGATGYFGAETQAAVAAWQKVTGVTPSAGYFGAISRARWDLSGTPNILPSTTTTNSTTGTTDTTPPPVPSSTSPFTKTLSYGMTGPEVSLLQQFLAKDPNVYPQGLVTGYYGEDTKQAVVNFQMNNGLAGTWEIGVVGPVTMAKLNALYTEGKIP